MAQKIKYALVSGQGTACAETVLYADEYTAENRAKAEADFCHDLTQPVEDRPIPGTWTDVSDNDAC
jgi:hypothetical protein